MRSYTLHIEGPRPLTVNQVAKLHRQQWAARTQQTRQLWWEGARNLHLPKLDRVTVDVTPLHKDRRSPQDVAACAPEAKAAIDGLVDAGVIPDDNPTHLIAVTFHPPAIEGIDGLRLTITEIHPTTGAAA